MHVVIPMSGVGKRFIEYILTSERLDFKTNLLARVNNIDELQEGMEHAVYSTIENPLFSTSDFHKSFVTENKDGRSAVYS